MSIYLLAPLLLCLLHCQRTCCSLQEGARYHWRNCFSLPPPPSLTILSFLFSEIKLRLHKCKTVTRFHPNLMLILRHRALAIGAILQCQTAGTIVKNIWFDEPFSKALMIHANQSPSEIHLYFVSSRIAWNHFVIPFDINWCAKVNLKVDAFIMFNVSNLRRCITSRNGSISSSLR